jgi:hypothetical protein
MGQKLDEILDATFRVAFVGLCVAAKPIEWLDDRIGPIPTVVVGLALGIAATSGLHSGLLELQLHVHEWLGGGDPLQG